VITRSLTRDAGARGREAFGSPERIGKPVQIRHGPATVRFRMVGTDATGRREKDREGADLLGRRITLLSSPTKTV